MEPISTTIVAALTAAAAAATKDVATQAVKDAYAGLKMLIVERYKRKATVEALEEDPASEAQQKALELALEKTRAIEDVEVIEQAEKLSTALSALPEESASALGLDIERFKAGEVRLKEIIAFGTAVRIRDTEVAGTFEAEGIRAGDTKK